MINAFINETIKLKSYLETINRKTLFMLGRSREVYQTILNYMSSCCSYSYQYDNERKLTDCLWGKDTTHINECLNTEEIRVLKVFLGNDGAIRFKKIWDRCTLYTFSMGFYRRSYRSKIYTKSYLYPNVAKLCSAIKLTAEGFTMEDYLNGRFASNNKFVIPDIIALEIDEANKDVLEKIRDIVYNESNSYILSREIIKGLLMSYNPEAHKMVGDLLLAAKLQEGLRQAIVECVDEGSVEGFKYITKLILDNNLERFSSVVRALDVWSGLGIQAQKPAVLRKCLEIGYKALTDADFAESCFSSDDNLYLYMGLWAKAVVEVKDTEKHLADMLESPQKYKKLTALYFLAQIQNSVFQYNMAKACLDSEDMEVLVWACRKTLTAA